jgi:hypothetical protein
VSAKGPNNPVLILDDGEFVALRELLDDLGVPYGVREDWKDVLLEEIPMPDDGLLVSSSRYAVQADGVLQQHPADTRPIHVVITGKTSKTACKIIGRLDCDAVLEEPVHPTILILLVRRAVHHGDERRTRERVAVNAPVKFKEKWRSYPATLIDLSHLGCKLTSPFAVEVGKQISVVLPKDLTGTKTTRVNGSVISGHDAGFNDSSEHAMSVIFCEPTVSVRRLLARIMSKHGLVHTTKINKELKQEGGGALRRPKLR